MLRQYRKLDDGEIASFNGTTGFFLKSNLFEPFKLNFTRRDLLSVTNRLNR